MRPILLKIKGLNSFMEEQTVDFARLMEPGLFGIFGPTGSGKTTILDGITLALYGEIARKSKNFVNTNCKSASVLYEFQISGAQTKRYRVEREFKQDANGEGYKTGKCRLSDITESEPVILADKVKEVNACCIEIIGLRADDFQRTVVLPQGRFSEFLKLEGKKRSEMLERLFRLQSYGDGLGRKLKAKSDEISHTRSNLEGQLKTFEDISKESVEEKKQEVSSLSEVLKEKTEAMRVFEKVYENSREIWNLQIDQEKHTQKKELLDGRLEEIRSMEQQLAQSEKAQRIRPYMEAAETSQKEADARQKELLSLQNEKEESEKRKQASEQEYSLWKQKREEELPIIREKIQAYKEAIESQTEYVQLMEQRKSIDKSLRSKDEERKQTLTEEAGLKKVIEENNQKLADLREKQKQYEISAQMRQQIQTGMGLEQQVKILNVRIEKAEAALDGLKKDSAEKKRNLDQLTSVLYQDGKMDDRSAAEYQNALYELKEMKKSYQDYIEKAAEKQQEMNQYAIQAKTLQDEKASVEHQYKTCKETKEHLELEMMSYQVRQSLQDGKPCPVCGSLHHELPEENETHSEQLQKVMREYTNLEKQFRELEKKEFSVTANLERMEKEQKELSEKANGLRAAAESLSEEEIAKRLKAIAEYEPVKVSVQMLSNSVSEKESELAKDKEEQKGLQQQLEELLQEVSYPSFAAAGEKLRKCDEMLEKIKGNLQRGTEITEARQREFEECQRKQNTLNTDIARFQEGIKNCQDRMESLQMKFSTNAKILDGISIEDVTLRGKLDACKEQEQFTEDSYQKAENRKETETSHFISLQGNYLEKKSAFELLQRKILDDVKRLDEMLKKEGVVSKEACLEAMLTEEQQLIKQKTIDAFKSEYSENEGVLSNIKEQLAGRSISHEKWAEMEQQKEEQESAYEELKVRYHNLLQIYTRMASDWERQKELLMRKKEIEHQESLMSDLMQLFRGKKFVEYVAFSKLNYISKAASHRLHDISNGNYGLELDPSGKFMVCDYKNGGVKRDAFTLSGGETFLVSLSLSLALSEQVQLKGTAPLELFFLDEGFGTLDDELLEVVMSSLERIQNKRLTVGIISHVEAVKNRVPIKLIVSPSVSGLGGTKVHIEKN